MKIAVGGMIASGKTTLTERLAKKLDFKRVNEFEKDDKVFNTLLQWLYEGVEDVEMLLQVYFLHHSWKSQKNILENSVVDREIIEHWLFAQTNLYKFPEILNMYNGVFHAYMNSHILPDLYIILDIDINTFRKRILERGRPQEVNNLEANMPYFKNLLKDYTKKLIAQCVLYDIKYKVIKVANLDKDEVTNEALNAVNEINNI